MKKILLLLSIAITSWIPLRAAQPDIDYSHIDVEILPFYSSQRADVDVGRFSSGLAATKEDKFLATIATMKKEWDKLTFPELYIAAIRLYNLGYRKEAVYWYYSARYRGIQFARLLEQSKMGSIGSVGFELYYAQSAFTELVGPYINGYAFSDPDGLIEIVKRVKEEGMRVPDLKAVYPGVVFKKKSEWQAANAELGSDMGELVSTIKEEKENIKRQRIEQGIEEQFTKLANKKLPGK